MVSAGCIHGRIRDEHNGAETEIGCIAVQVPRQGGRHVHRVCGDGIPAGEAPKSPPVDLTDDGVANPIAVRLSSALSAYGAVVGADRGHGGSRGGALGLPDTVFNSGQTTCEAVFVLR